MSSPSRPGLARSALFAFAFACLAMCILCFSGANDFARLKCGRDGQCEFVKQTLVFPTTHQHFPASHIQNPDAEVRVERYMCGRTNSQHCLNILLVSATGQIELLHGEADNESTEGDAERLRRAIASAPPWDLVFRPAKTASIVFGCIFLVAGLFTGREVIYGKNWPKRPVRTALWLRAFVAWGAMFFGAGIGAVVAVLLGGLLSLTYPDNVPVAVVVVVLGAVGGIALAIYETRPRAD